MKKFQKVKGKFQQEREAQAAAKASARAQARQSIEEDMGATANSGTAEELPHEE